MHRHSTGCAQHSKVPAPNDQQIEQTKIRWELLDEVKMITIID